MNSAYHVAHHATLMGLPRKTIMKSKLSSFAQLSTMKKKSISVKSNTDWARLRDIHRLGAPTVEHPEADVKYIVRGIVRRGASTKKDTP
jgi:hypothetical protein